MAIRAKSGVTPGTAVPFAFGIDAGFWPSGVESADAIVKCYQISDINPGSSTPITVNTTALTVFSGGSSSTGYATLTPSGPTTLNLTFPTATAGKQIIITITATGEDPGLQEEFYFEGANIVVVDP